MRIHIGVDIHYAGAVGRTESTQSNRNYRKLYYIIDIDSRVEPEVGPSCATKREAKGERWHVRAREITGQWATPSHTGSITHLCLPV